MNRDDENRLRIAINSRNPVLIRNAVAKTTDPVPLGMALAILDVIREKQPALYQAAALRWLARYIAEHADANLARAGQAASLLAALDRDPSAMAPLRQLARP